MYVLAVKDFDKFVQELSLVSPPDILSSAGYSVLKSHASHEEYRGADTPAKFIHTVTTIRTDYSNEVLMPLDSMFYQNVVSAYPEKHLFEDTLMLAAQKWLNTNTCIHPNHIMDVIMRTQFVPQGVFVFEDNIYVYTHVIMDSKLKEDPIFRVVSGCVFEPILKLRGHSHFVHELLKTLVIVSKEEVDNAVQ